MLLVPELKETHRSSPGLTARPGCIIASGAVGMLDRSLVLR